MDKNAIKKYAVWARRELIERVSRKALQYGITADGTADPNADIVDGRVLSSTEKRQRQALIRKVNEHGYESVCEEVAYIWFNRFIALRFMEVNAYLPSHVRVFTDDAGEFKPQILSEAIHLDLDGLDMKRVYELKSADKEEELFKYLLIVQCNALNRILPGMFQKIADYTELLLPDNLLREGSVIERMVNQEDGIPEQDWTDQVQIIGWLYQYYNTEPKDQVFADLKKNIKITKENIPAATQLFTPDWIVRYMVENSLGRLWLEGHPNDTLKAEWKYYLDEAEQEADVQEQLDAIRTEYAALKPEDIRCIDPCMGSGHILCYIFDVLVSIYEDYGYSAREAAANIIENNLWGLDIDERAAQLAYFAVMMKARQYDRRFFNKKDENGNLAIMQPHVYAIAESNDLDPYAVEYFVDGRPELKSAMDMLKKELHDAKEYGSILTVTPQDWSVLYARFDEVEQDISWHRDLTLRQLKPVVQVAQALAQKYHAVVTNPPYMGAGNMNGKLSGFIKRHFADYKSDFFSAFVVRCSEMATPNGKLGFFTPYVWMFIQSYEKLRNYLYNRTIETLIQFEYSAFEEATVPVCTFTFSNYYINKKGCYLRLTDFRGGMKVQRQKVLEAIANHECGFYYEQSADNFSKIPGSPVAYWVSVNWFDIFEKYPIMRDVTVLKKGTSTGDNSRFIRQWSEVDFTNIFFLAHNPEEAAKSKRKWFPINGGGERRKWYGNRYDVVNWENDGIEMKALATKLNHGGHWSRYIINPYKFFTESIGWSAVSSARISARYVGYGFAFSSAAMEAFEHDIKYIMALINSVVTEDILKLLAPTLNFGVEQVGKIPVILSRKDEVEKYVEHNITLSKQDWDAFETSWDFKMHPFVRKALSRSHCNSDGDTTIEDVYKYVAQDFEERFQTIKANEEELNRIFIDIYGLQDELTPEVEDKDVTVRRADLQRDIKSLISYAVGCMFGRYSLDVNGLAYAGGEWDESKYSTFIPDKDNIIPICSDEYFDDDIFGRFVKFIEVVFGESTLEENLKFIADALGGSGTPREVIRNYFLKGFYADHCKTYQKRPIYWLFDSGRQNGFKCLVYMHRYQPDTIARIRTDYVHEQQSRYRTAIADLEQRLNGVSTSERVKLNKKLSALEKQAAEIKVYEEEIHHLADQMIAIDLDDGVKHNYEFFKDVLAKIK